MHQSDNLDGVVEVFKEKDKQGYVMKIYKTFDPNDDLCVWVWEDIEKKTVNTRIGNHSNCNEYNQCIGFGFQDNEYPIITNIKRDIVSNLLEDIYGYYTKSIRM